VPRSDWVRSWPTRSSCATPDVSHVRLASVRRQPARRGDRPVRETSAPTSCCSAWPITAPSRPSTAVREGGVPPPVLHAAELAMRSVKDAITCTPVQPRAVRRLTAAGRSSAKDRSGPEGRVLSFSALPARPPRSRIRSTSAVQLPIDPRGWHRRASAAGE
jgi:hypothetical protein